MIVVTGATGHIGNVLVRALLDKGEEVRVFLLPGEPTDSLDGLHYQTARGNIMDVKSLAKAFQGADYVIHLTGIISITPGHKKELEEINVQGTKNVISACLRAEVKRMVYVSSIHAFVEPPKKEYITEDSPVIPEGVKGQYAKTKAEATLAVLKAVKNKGLDAVVCCPTGVIGPYDYKISEMGRLILDFARKKLKAYLNGAYDFVDVRDVAEGLYLAAKKGKKGEIYILSGERVSIREILDILQEATGANPPDVVLPAWLAIAVSPFAILHYRLRRQKPLFTAYSVKTLMSNSRTDHAKPRRELGYTARSVRESMADAFQWFRDNGYINRQGH